MTVRLEWRTFAWSLIGILAAQLLPYLLVGEYCAIVHYCVALPFPLLVQALPFAAKVCSAALLSFCCAAAVIPGALFLTRLVLGTGKSREHREERI